MRRVVAGQTGIKSLLLKGQHPTNPISPKRIKNAIVKAGAEYTGIVRVDDPPCD